MSAWGDSELLVELLERQFEYLGKLGGTDKIVRLGRVLAFIQGQPALAGVLEELQVEATGAAREFEAADAAAREELRVLWAAHGGDLRRQLAGVTDDACFAWGSFETFEGGLAASTVVTIEVKHDTFEEEHTTKLADRLTDWWKWACDLAKERGESFGDGPLAHLGRALETLSRACAYQRGRLRQAKRALAWPAYQRLIKNAAALNPTLPDSQAGEETWYKFSLAAQFADAVGRWDYDHVDIVEDHEVEAMHASMLEDSKLLYEELRLRVGLNRSRIAMVQRYAARCEAFDAQRLRDLCAADTANAERLLTLDFARYLFDAGLHPLIDSTIAGLRPDILHVSSVLFYVEAKQYSSDNPRSQLKKAYSQVWGTWGRIRKTYPSDEAFLVVFRRSGPWVELPKLIRHDGLKLFSVVADISGEGGSRERQQAIALAEDELRPQAGDAAAEGGSRERQQAIALAEDELRLQAGHAAAEGTLSVPRGEMSLPEVLDDLERQLILKAYEQAKGVKTETARLLGIKTSALYYKLEKYGIQ